MFLYRAQARQKWSDGPNWPNKGKSGWHVSSRPSPHPDFCLPSMSLPSGDLVAFGTAGLINPVGPKINFLFYFIF